MRHRESQVCDTGFEVVHEAGDRAVVLVVIICDDASREVGGDGLARHLIGRLYTDLELRPHVFPDPDHQIAHAMGKAAYSLKSR